MAIVPPSGCLTPSPRDGRQVARLSTLRGPGWGLFWCRLRGHAEPLLPRLQAQAASRGGDADPSCPCPL